MTAQFLEIDFEKYKPKFPFDKLVISLFKECTPKILVVTEGGLSFGTSDFGLFDFVNTLKTTSIHGMMPIVETAHRGASAADYTSFTFTSSSLSINKYDVLFLFGIQSSGSLPVAERDVISDFMDAGGGVFATGDHANLGKFLCGDIPRVREMRRWTGPSASGTDRISTNDPGSDNQFQFGDQSDEIAQKIYPVYNGTMLSSEPHALLQHPTKRVIEVLPDHPHESECTVPASLADTSEWPLTSGGATVSPEIIALSMSYGGGFSGKQPISEPRSFGAISTYDGHLAEVGRISTDATWHHFVNINIVATASGVGLVANPDAYNRVSTYYGNIANWLMPKKTRKCLRWPLIVTIRDLYPIAEFIPELLDQPEDIGRLADVGRETQNALARFMGAAQQRDIIADLISEYSERSGERFQELRCSSNDIAVKLGRRMVPVEVIEHVTLGALVLTAVQALPPGEDVKSSLKKAGGFEGLDKMAKENLSTSFKKLGALMQKGRSYLDEVLEVM